MDLVHNGGGGGFGPSPLFTFFFNVKIMSKNWTRIMTKIAFKTRFEKKKKNYVTFTLGIHSSIFLQTSQQKEKKQQHRPALILSLDYFVFSLNLK